LFEPVGAVGEVAEQLLQSPRLARGESAPGDRVVGAEGRRHQPQVCREGERALWGVAPRQPRGRQLERGTVARDAQTQSLGQVAEITPERDFGFLITKEGGLLYFHRNSVLSGNFDELKRGDEVHYNESVGDTGPIATKVRVKARE